MKRITQAILAIGLVIGGIVAAGCDPNANLPKADQQSKLPPSNTIAGQAARRYQQKQAGGPRRGPNSGAQSLN